MGVKGSCCQAKQPEFKSRNACGMNGESLVLYVVLGLLHSHCLCGANPHPPTRVKLRPPDLPQLFGSAVACLLSCPFMNFYYHHPLHYGAWLSVLALAFSIFELKPPFGYFFALWFPAAYSRCQSHRLHCHLIGPRAIQDVR